MGKITAKDVANYYLFLDSQDENSNGICNLKMQKLVYFAYSFFAGATNKPMFDEKIKAWDYGPVVSELYTDFKDNRYKPIPFSGTLNLDIFHEDAKYVIEQTYQHYNSFAPGKLVSLSHEQNGPWAQVYNWEGSNDVIPFAMIQEHFAPKVGQIGIKMSTVGQIITPEDKTEIAEMARASQFGMQSAYDDDEYEYTDSDFKWINPKYAKQ